MQDKALLPIFGRKHTFSGLYFAIKQQPFSNVKASRTRNLATEGKIFAFLVALIFSIPPLK
ncbi:MAG TPA: hypothetical protein DHH42_06425 [Clostridiales bacterium]|nr:hypothetical protein [Clostridiales bacterium]